VILLKETNDLVFCKAISAVYGKNCMERINIPILCGKNSEFLVKRVSKLAC